MPNLRKRPAADTNPAPADTSPPPADTRTRPRPTPEPRSTDRCQSRPRSAGEVCRGPVRSQPTAVRKAAYAPAQSPSTAEAQTRRL